MKKRLFNYISPLLYPLFPASTGDLTVALDLVRICGRAISPPSKWYLTVVYSIFCDGKQIRSGERKIEVHGNEPRDSVLILTENGGDRLCYLEVNLTAELPLFGEIVVDPGYALLKRTDHGEIAVIATEKYANPRIIDQIKAHQRFCMSHQACFVDASRNIGNSIVLINPYRDQIVARFISGTGRKLSAKMAPQSIKLVDLAPILDQSKWETVMVTANNRVITYDMRHPADRQDYPNSLDHLDPYRGEPTFTSASVRKWARYQVGRIRGALREQALRRFAKPPQKKVAGVET